jgi:LuxR family maltose regulon positive regulatory protein
VWAYLLTGEFEQADRQLTGTAALLDDPADVAQLDTLRALMVSLREGQTTSLAAAEHAYDQSSAGSAFTRGLGALNLASTFLFQGELEPARKYLSEAETHLRQAGNHAFAALAAAAQSDVDALCGQLRRAAAGYDAIQREFPPVNGSHMPTKNSAVIGLAELDLEWNRLARAERALDTLGAVRDDVVVEPRLYLARAGVYAAQARFDAAQEELDRARGAIQHFPLPFFSYRYSERQAALYLARGEPDLAERWLHARGVHAEMPVTFPREGELLVYAELLLARSEIQSALSLLERLHSAVDAAGRVPRRLHVELLQSFAFEANGDPKRAEVVLARALAYAFDEGYVRTFVDRGVRMARALAQLQLASVPLRAYRAELLAAFEGPAPESTIRNARDPAATGGTARANRLSQRELEVLRLLADGLTNSEIAQRLVVTSGTVKWHLNNIFGKLDVHNRTQAVARAREYDLLA